MFQEGVTPDDVQDAIDRQKRLTERDLHDVIPAG